MDENTNHRNLDKPPDADWLDKWIRLATDHAEEAPVELPPEEDIESYLHGTASDAQRRRIQEALVKSQDFRKELVEHAGVLRAQSGTRQEARVPWYEQFVAAFRMPRVAVPVAATIVLLAAMFVWQDWSVGDRYSANILTATDAANWRGAAMELPAVISTRDGSAEADATVISADDAILLQLPVLVFRGDPAPEFAEIEAESGEIVWSVSLSPFDTIEGKIRIVVDASTFTAGTYWINVLSADRKRVARSLIRIERS